MGAALPVMFCSESGVPATAAVAGSGGLSACGASGVAAGPQPDKKKTMNRPATSRRDVAGECVESFQYVRTRAGQLDTAVDEE